MFGLQNIASDGSHLHSDANNLLDMANCLICLETYTELIRAPILTACGHTFCRECVEKATVNHVFKCFECREITLYRNGFKINISVLQCLQTMNLLALEAPMAHADAVEKSKVIVDENQKLVDNITIALTEYVVRKGDELPVVDDAIDILEEAMEIITGDDDSDSDSDSDDDNDNDNVNDMYCTQNHISGNFILNNGGVNTLPLLRTATPRLEYASFFTS